MPGKTKQSFFVETWKHLKSIYLWSFHITFFLFFCFYLRFQSWRPCSYWDVPFVRIQSVLVNLWPPEKEEKRQPSKLYLKLYLKLFPMFYHSSKFGSSVSSFISESVKCSSSNLKKIIGPIIIEISLTARELPFLKIFIAIHVNVNCIHWVLIIFDLSGEQCVQPENNVTEKRIDNYAIPEMTGMPFLPFLDLVVHLVVHLVVLNLVVTIILSCLQIGSIIHISLWCLFLGVCGFKEIV